MGPQLNYEDYTIGWICALPLEATAAMFMLDHVHDGEFPWKRGQETVYTGGSINGRNVVIACLSKGENAIGSAARVASQMRASFPNLAFGLMVGIGAGVPSPDRDIRLGDVIVSVPEGMSGGVIGYDLGKETIEGFETKGWCNATDPALRSAIARNEYQSNFKGSDFTRYLQRLKGKAPSKVDFAHPGSSSDKLYHAIQIDTVLQRPPRDSQDPIVHHGLIASGDKVIKNAVLRDQLHDKHGIICFEMEAAGLMNVLPVAVIRGVSDYADSHKNDLWQPYAAGSAAAYARGLLDAFSADDHTHTRESADPVHLTPQIIAGSTVPFSRDSKNFIGRDEVLSSIEQGFKNQRRLVLVGLGGIGKSQIAVEVSYRLREKEPDTWVFWVQVNNPSRFKQSFADIARKVNLPKIEHPEHDFLQEVTDWLSNAYNGRWLLILDNCDDIHVLCTEVVGIPATATHEASETRPLMSYIPQAEHGLILATSRSKEVAFTINDEEDAHIPVLPMTQREAVQLFRTKLPHDKSSSQDVTELSNELGYIPLAIKQAAAYMHNTHMTMTKYLEYFRQNEAVQTKFLLSDIPDARRDPDLKNSIISTWQISFDQILEQTRSAADLLALMSAYDRQSIPKLLLLEEDNRGDPLTNIRFDESVSVLENYSLVAKLEDESFTMHRLVQFSTQKWLQRQKTELHWQEKALNILARRFPTDEWENWETCDKLYPHAQLMMSYTFEKRSSLESLATLLHHVGMYDKQQGRYVVAHQAVSKAYQIRLQYLGRHDEATLASLNSLGAVMEKEGKWNDAENAHRRVLSVRHKVLRDNNIHTLENMNSLGIDLMNQGKYHEAEKLLRKALKSEKVLLSQDSPELWSCMNNLGCVLGKQGKLKESIKLHRKALEHHVKSLGNNHPSTAETLSFLGSRLREDGEYEEAESKLKRSLELRTKILGPEHLETLGTSAELAENMIQQGLITQPRAILEEVLSIQTRSFGLAHPATVATAQRIGCLLYESGKATEGITLLQNALEQNEKNLGRSNPLSLRLLQEIASCHKVLNELEEAENLEREILHRQETTIGSENPDTVVTKSNLATTIILQGKFQEAEKLSWSALDISQRVFGTQHPSTIEYHAIYCYILDKANQKEKAIKEFREVIVSLSKIMGDEHHLTDGTRHNLAVALIERGGTEDLKEAEALERTALEHGLGQFGTEHAWCLSKYQWLAKSLLLQGRLGDAEPYARLAFGGCRRLLDPGNTRTGLCANILKEVLEKQGKSLNKDLESFLSSHSIKEPSMAPAQHNVLHLVSESRTILSEWTTYFTLCGFILTFVVLYYLFLYG